MSYFGIQPIENNIQDLERLKEQRPQTYKEFILEQDRMPYSNAFVHLFPDYANEQRRFLARLGIHMNLPEIESNTLNKMSATLTGIDLRYEDEIEEQQRLEQLVGKGSYWPSIHPSYSDLINYNRYNTLIYLSGDGGSLLEVKNDLKKIKSMSDHDIVYKDPLSLLSGLSSITFYSYSLLDSNYYTWVICFVSTGLFFNRVKDIAKDHKPHQRLERYKLKLTRMDEFLKEHYSSKFEA
jgi:hypothetical protein